MNPYVFASVVVLIVLANVVVAFLRRKDVTFATYAADPDRYNWCVIAITLTGTIVGGGMFLAVGQIGYEAGVVGFVLGIIYIVGLLIVGAFAERIRHMMVDGQHDTLMELLEKNYDRAVVVQFCVVNLVMYTFLLAGQFVAMFQFCRFVEPSAGYIIPWGLVSLGGIAIFLYPIIGGLRKDIQTDVFQLITVLVASIFIAVQLVLSGALRTVWSDVPKEHLTGTGYGAVFTFGAILFLTPSFLVRLDVWQRLRAARSESDARVGVWLAGLLACGFYVFFTLIGMWARAAGSTDAEKLSNVVDEFPCWRRPLRPL